MSKEITLIELYQSPKYEKNADLDPKEAEDDRCVCCNKPLNTKDKYWVHMETGWKIVPNGAEIEIDYSHEEEGKIYSQGMFPVGNACAKKIPKEYKIKH